MVYRDTLFAAIALAVSTLAIAAVLNTEVYSQAAQAEASGYDALTTQVQGASPALCWTPAETAGRASQSVHP
ncbi:MAG: hypothetical protein V4754_18540 [Pseudomonadota bacterium]